MVEEGSGDRVAVLLHGMMGSAESWWRVSRALAAGGYRVLALDLPGHGGSPRDPGLTVECAAQAVVDTVRLAGTASPDVAIGHSLGGVVLAAASTDLGARLTVLVDAIPVIAGGIDPSTLVPDYERSRAARTDPAFLASRSGYGPRDVEVEARAALRFDPATTAPLTSGPARSWSLPEGSVVVRARPSAYVTDHAADDLRSQGIAVRDVPGAGHSIWFGHFVEFVDALPEVFAPTA